MSVDKVPNCDPFPSLALVLERRIAFEDTLARFDEQIQRSSPEVIRKRFRQRLTDIQVDINGQFDN
jgi:hypothetical protein